MKKLALLSILGLVVLTVNAQTAPNDSTVTISGTKTVMEEHAQAMSADSFRQFAGSYELSNGNSVALFTRGLTKYAALHGEAWHELVATSSNSFVAKDHQLKIDIVREDDGTVHGDVYLPKNTVQTADSRTVGQLVKVAFH